MSDDELNSLLNAVTNVADPLDQPPEPLLDYLRQLPLAEGDFEILLGDDTGLSWDDLKRNMESFFSRLRLRLARLICRDHVLKSEVASALETGLDAGWEAVIGVFGLSPTTAAAKALKPIAVSLAKAGLQSLCECEQ